MEHIIQSILTDAASVKQKVAQHKDLISGLATIHAEMQTRIKKGGTIYACGNGGSTCDAMHFVEELVARFKRERPGIKAMHFMDPSTLTCWSNDYEYSSAFQRYAETFCGPTDVFFGFSTSGNSSNVIKAVEAAKAKGTYTVIFSGKDGGKLKNLADISLIVPSEFTERIQEVHILFVHILCELLETESR